MIRRLFSNTLMLSYIPLLLLGFLLAGGMFPRHVLAGIHPCEMILGYTAGIIVGACSHELLGHIFVGQAYHEVCEGVGIGLSHYQPYVYVIMDRSRNRNVFRRIQADAAGIEVNLLICAVCYLLISCKCMSPVILWEIAQVNFFLAIINAFPAPTYDGYYVLRGILTLKTMQKGDLT